MGMFCAREPRGFRRVSIYTSERDDKLQKLVEDEKRRTGELPPETDVKDKFKGKFSEFTPRAKRFSEDPKRLSWPIALFIILVLILVWHYLQTGRVHL